MIGSNVECFTMTVVREVWDEESLEIGETDDMDSITRKVTFEEAIRQLRTCDELSQDPVVNGRAWAIALPMVDYKTGNHITESTFIRDLDDKPLKVHQLMRLFRLARLIR